MKTRTTEPAASRGGLRTGVLRGIPVLLGYFPVALAFGVMARNLPLPYAVMMSAVVYAGASQFMALNLLAGGVLELQPQAGGCTRTIDRILETEIRCPQHRLIRIVWLG